MPHGVPIGKLLPDVENDAHGIRDAPQHQEPQAAFGERGNEGIHREHHEPPHNEVQKAVDPVAAL